jgi:hypothetical protein
MASRSRIGCRPAPAPPFPVRDRRPLRASSVLRAIRERLWPSRSWRSRAIRSRSSATARRASSSRVARSSRFARDPAERGHQDPDRDDRQDRGRDRAVARVTQQAAVRDIADLLRVEGPGRRLTARTSLRGDEGAAVIAKSSLLRRGRDRHRSDRGRLARTEGHPRAVHSSRSRASNG